MEITFIFYAFGKQAIDVISPSAHIESSMPSSNFVCFMSEAKTPLTSAVEEAFLLRWRQISPVRAYYSSDYNPEVISQADCLGWASFLSNSDHWEQVKQKSVPTVNFSNRHGALDWAVNVFMDDAEIGRIAAEKLRSLGYKNFAFIGIEDHGYSKDREHGFVFELERTGHAAMIFNWDESHSNNPILFTEHRRQLTLAWLDQLTRATGILAANDFAACTFIDLVKEVEPEALNRLAIIGVDNSKIGESKNLSSILPNFVGMGFAIADELSAIAGVQSLEMGKIRRIAGARLIERATTKAVRDADPLISAVLRRITDIVKAGEAPRIELLSKEYSISRRTLLNRFRSATGQTLRDYCLRERLIRAAQLLRETEMNIAEIAQACGYAKQGELTVQFRRTTGLTPKTFRSEGRGLIQNKKKTSP